MLVHKQSLIPLRDRSRSTRASRFNVADDRHFGTRLLVRFPRLSLSANEKLIVVYTLVNGFGLVTESPGSQQD